MNNQNHNFFRLPLFKAMAMMDFIHSQILVEKARVEVQEFFFDVQIPSEFSVRPMFAQVDVGIGDVYQITFHYYPNHVLH